MLKIKHFFDSNTGKDMLVITIVILVGIISFELGRLSKSSTNEGLKIDYTAIEDNKTTKTTGDIRQMANKFTNPGDGTKNGNFVASSKGTKFYGITCSAGKSIKEENKIYFQTADEAIRAGYEASTACK